MAKKRKKSRSSNQGNADLRTIVVKALFGALTGLIVYFILLAIMSFIALKADMSESPYKYMVFASGIISGFVCGFTSVRPIRKNGIVIGSLSTLPMFLIAALICFLISGAGIGAMGWLLALAMIIFGAVGGVFAVNKRK